MVAVNGLPPEDSTGTRKRFQCSPEQLVAEEALCETFYAAHFGPQKSDAAPENLESVDSLMRLWGELLARTTMTVWMEKWEIEKVRGDGNCLFYSLSAAEKFHKHFRRSRDHVMIRRLAVGAMERHYKSLSKECQEEYEALLRDEMKHDGKVPKTNMVDLLAYKSKDGVFGTFEDIVSYERASGIGVCVWEEKTHRNNGTSLGYQVVREPFHRGDDDPQPVGEDAQANRVCCVSVSSYAAPGTVSF